jgi:hypothetical protein
MLKIVGLVAIAAVAAAAAPLPTAAGTMQRQAWMLVRTTTGPSSFELGIFTNYTAAGGFIGGLFTEESNGNVLGIVGGGMTSIGPGEPTAYISGTRIDSCTLPVCPLRTVEGQTGLGEFYSDSGATGAINRGYFIAEGASVSATLYQASGWSLQAAPLGYRYVDGDSGGNVSARVLDSGVEVFTGASIYDGSSRGSFAQADPPCSITSSSLVARGVGTLTLTGGVRRPSETCPQGQDELDSWSNGPTRWQLTGPVVGDSSQRHTRLLMIERP